MLAALRERAEREYATAMDLNDFAWVLLTVEPEGLRDNTLALQWAERAVDRAEESKEPQDRLANILDTLALGCVNK